MKFFYEITFEDKGRRGIEAQVPKINRRTPSHIKRLRRESFNYVGPNLWNSIPKEIRAFKAESKNHVLAFKNKLNQYLQKIPDEPTVYGLHRSAPTNSIIDQKHYIIS